MGSLVKLSNFIGVDNGCDRIEGMIDEPIKTKTEMERSEWLPVSQQHRQAIVHWTEPFRQRRRIGKSHPVHDFLFVYYQYSPAKLEQWHPGVDVVLLDCSDDQFSQWPYHRQGRQTWCQPTEISEKELRRLQWIVQLLQNTSQAVGNYSCLGLHEWAMVYQGTDVRHQQTTGLRLPQTEIDELVRSRPIRCSHFDAYRFFAEEARPLNRLSPTMESRLELEQPACIHANMDLYKWAFKSMPWVGSELLRECFDLAMQARQVDMRASPYDLTPLDGFEPIRIETAAGRVEYEQAQRTIADAAKPIRERLIQRISRVISLASS